MSYVPIIGATAATAAAAAAKRMREEEEKLTSYNTDDLKGWEFKIVRSTLQRFKNPEAVRKLCEQEARYGWEMLEKFDDGRIRFKRRTDRRSADSHIGGDPYRTSSGISEGGFAALIVVIILTVMGLVALFVFMDRSSIAAFPAIAVGAAACLVLILVVFVARNRRG